MRHPAPLCSIHDLEADKPREVGEPRTARVSRTLLADMHEAMDVEEEYQRRWDKHFEQKQKAT